MKQIKLADTDFSVSRFVFGQAKGPTAKGRQALLHAAAEAGFSHFDTAPYYAFGHAERDLRPVLSAHPSLTVTTKTGLYSPGGEWQPEWLTIARKAAGRLAPGFSRPVADLAVDRARRSLTDSLKRLGRERVELFLLHEPEVALLPTDEWARFLEDEVRRGRILHFGIAADTHRVQPFLAVDHPLLRVVQTRDSLDRREADVLISAGRPMQLTYGYLSQRPPPPNVAGPGDVLDLVLARNPHGAIIVRTSRMERLKAFTEAVDRELS